MPRYLGNICPILSFSPTAMVLRGNQKAVPSFSEYKDVGIAKLFSYIFQVRSVYFPRELLRPSSLLTNLVLDDTRSSNTRLASSCDHLFAYISDTVAPG